MCYLRNFGLICLPSTKQLMQFIITTICLWVCLCFLICTWISLPILYSRFPPGLTYSLSQLPFIFVRYHSLIPDSWVKSSNMLDIHASYLFSPRPTLFQQRGSNRGTWYINAGARKMAKQIKEEFFRGKKRLISSLFCCVFVWKTVVRVNGSITELLHQ